MTLSRVVLPLRLALAVLFAVLLVLQLLSFPGQFRHMAETDPASAELRWPLTAAVFVVLLCVQVVVVATWKLLGLVEADRIFSPVAFRWVDAIVRALAVGWTVLLALFLLVGFRADDPGPVILMFLVLVAGGVVGLLMLVMRALLRQATALRSDLEAVI